MRLIESVSKEVLASYGLKPPAGRLCATPAEARTAAEELGGAVFVKAQIPFGDRATLGLVGRVEDPEAAAQAAGEYLARTVDGLRVGSVLVEQAAAPDVSAYISVHVDDQAAARVLRIGHGGGAGYHPEDAEIQEPIPVGGLELFQVRNLVGRLGVTGVQREAVTRAAWAVLRAASEWHAYTVEVNPLFITDAGPVAIDAKMELDPYSLATVPRPELLPEKEESPPEREARLYNEQDHRGSMRYVQLVNEADPGDADPAKLVGSHSVGGGESMVVFDALADVGLVPTNYCDTSGAPSQEKVAFAAKLIASQPHIRGYFFSSCIANQPLSVTAAGLIDGFRAANWRGPTLVRIAGNQDEQAQEMIRAWAAEVGVDATVVGREVDEWEAAEMLARELENMGVEQHGVSH
jgi:succinyl-CoA synthetase beta subunit